MILTYETAKLDGATYIDLNNLLGVSLEPDLLTDVKAIRGSIYNILMTPLGTRYRLPEFGSALLWLLQQPRDLTTAFQIKNAVTVAIDRWEPRVEIDFAQTQVTLFGLDGYSMDLVFRMPRFNQTVSFSLNIRRPG